MEAANTSTRAAWDIWKTRRSSVCSFRGGEAGEGDRLKKLADHRPFPSSKVLLPVVSVTTVNHRLETNEPPDVVLEGQQQQPSTFTSVHLNMQAFYYLSSLQEKGGVQYDKIVFERDHIDITFITVCGYNFSILLLVRVVNLLLSLIYVELYHMYVSIEKNIVYTVNPCTTQVLNSQVHLFTDFFQ